MKRKLLGLAPMCTDCASPCGRTADPGKDVFTDPLQLAIEKELLVRLLQSGASFYGKAELSRLLARADGWV